MNKKIALIIILCSLCLTSCNGVNETHMETDSSSVVSSINSTESTSTSSSSIASSSTSVNTSSSTSEVVESSSSSISESISSTSSSESSSEPVENSSSSEVMSSTSTVDVKDPEWTETEVSEDFFVKTNGVNGRQKPIQGNTVVKKYNTNDKVHVVALTSTGYYKTNNGDYVHKDYLSKTKIEVMSSSSSSSTKPSKSEYVDAGAWLPIPKSLMKDYYYNNDGSVYVWGVDEYLIRPAYEKLLKQIPGYVSGSFAFRNVPNKIENMKFAHLTKANAQKISDLLDHYYNDLTRLGWGAAKNNDSYLNQKRERIFGLIDTKYCAMNSNIGEYAPDGSQYTAKNLDGCCYVAKTELSHLYWIVSPRKFKRVPEGTYIKSGLGGGVSNEPKEGYKDVSGRYVIPDYFVTVVSDNDYENKWYSEKDHCGVCWGISDLTII